MAHRLGFTLLTLLAASLIGGCDEGPQVNTGGAAQGGGGAAQGGSGGQGGAGGDTGGTLGTGGLSAALFPPTDQDAIFQWLKDGNYIGWLAESAPHPSTGPHGGGVRAFVNATLEASLTAGNSVHPKGAAVVKELYGNGSTVTGWAVSAKTDADSAGGQGWYWYEIYSTTDPSSPVVAGNGKSLCFNCHAGGTDYVLSPFPLQ